MQQLGFDLLAHQFQRGSHPVNEREKHFIVTFCPPTTCRKLCGAMRDFRGNTVLTFDLEGKGAIVSGAHG